MGGSPPNEGDKGPVSLLSKRVRLIESGLPPKSGIVVNADGTGADLAIDWPRRQDKVKRYHGRKIQRLDGSPFAAGFDALPFAIPSDLGEKATYRFERGHLLFVVAKEKGEDIIVLANFDARIIETVTKHDGLSETVYYRIAVLHRTGLIREVTVKASDYRKLDWVYDCGPEFTINAGRDIKDRIRHAIQIISAKSGIETRVVHTALGWLRTEGRWVYRHAGGILGAEGHSAALTVDPVAALRHYRLPAPPDILTLRRAVEAHFGLWRLASKGRAAGGAAGAVAASLPWRAVLGWVNFTVHISGPTGTRKTSLAILVYQHFADVRGRGVPMPASWTDTANSIQRLQFDAADTVLIVDDLKFNRSVEAAETVFQAQGNGQSRARMNIDQSLQPALNPQGALLSTGECDPETQSAQGRALIIEIGGGDLDLEVLAQLQAAGDEGLFRALMSAFICWLAPRLDDIRREHQQRAAEIRGEIEGMVGAHPRHPDMIAQLVAAYEIFLRFAVESGAIGQDEGEHYAAVARRELIAIGKGQADHQEESKPGRRFLDLIGSSLLGGHCYLLPVEPDGEPDQPTACGWRLESQYEGKDQGQQPTWKKPANGKCIGFVDATFVYLDTVESVAMATGAARRQGGAQVVSFSKIGRAMGAEGLCEPRQEGKKTRNDPRISLQGIRKRFFVIPRQHLMDDQKPEKEGKKEDWGWLHTVPVGPPGPVDLSSLEVVGQ